MITRIQRKRHPKGVRLPPKTLCIGRPGPFGNQFLAEDQPGATEDERRRHAVMSFRLWCGTTDLGRAMLEKLVYRIAHEQIKHLACWCGVDECCHGDVLVEFLGDPNVLRFPKVGDDRVFVFPTAGGFRAVIGKILNENPLKQPKWMSISGVSVLGVWPTALDAIKAGEAAAQATKRGAREVSEMMKEASAARALWKSQLGKSQTKLVASGQ